MMSPQTKKLLTIGVPIALAVVGLVIVTHRSSSPQAPAASAAGSSATSLAGEVQASQDALATYESYTQQQLAAITTRIAKLDGTGTTTPTAKGAPPIEPPAQGYRTRWAASQPSSGPTVATAANQVIPGGTEIGYTNTLPGPIDGATGSGYQGFTNWAAASAYMGAGGTLYDEPTPGNFQAVSANGQLTIPGGTNTTLYMRQG